MDYNAESGQLQDTPGGEETSQEACSSPGESSASSKEYGEHLVNLRDIEKINLTRLSNETLRVDRH